MSSTPIKDRKYLPDEKVPNEILSYIHCGKCLHERPEATSPAEWADLEFGFTERGLQIWCRRHECNLVHIDFEDHTHPALTHP